MTIKNAKSPESNARTVPSETKPTTTTQSTREPVQSPSKPKKDKPGKAAHVEALRVLRTAVDRGDLKDGADEVIMAFIKTVQHRLKPYARVTYED